MIRPASTQLRIVTAVGIVMVAVGLTLGLTGWGLTGMWIAILVFTPICVALEHHAARRAQASGARQHAGKARARA